MGENGDDGLDVHVTVEGNTIIVTLPGTTFCVAYRKTPDSPWLLASDIRDDHKSGISRWTFRARAWTAANEKARELGQHQNLGCTLHQVNSAFFGLGRPFWLIYLWVEVYGRKTAPSAVLLSSRALRGVPRHLAGRIEFSA